MTSLSSNRSIRDESVRSWRRGGPSAPQPSMAGYALIVVLSISITVRVLGFLIPEYANLFAPFHFFSTFVHEEFHCLSTYLVNGYCVEFTIHRNLGGTARVVSAMGETGSAIIAAAGLLAPAMVGSFLMIFGSQPSYRMICWLALIGLICGALPFITGDFAMGATIVLVIVLLIVGVFGKQSQTFLINVTGTQLHLASFDDWDYMFSTGFTRDGEYWTSDTQYIAQALWPHHYIFWGAVIAIFSLVLLVYSIKVSLNNFERQLT